MTHPGLDDLGRLTPWGRLRQLGQSMALRWSSSPGPQAPLTLADLPRPPGGPTARRALIVSEEASPPWLHAHVLRTWSWASLLGKAAGLRPDPELLFVACVLHDLGLTDQFAPEAEECFALAGARHACRLLEAEGVPAPFARRVADAVALHLEVRVSLAQGVEAKLLRDGAGLDVLGQGASALPPELRRAVLRDYPRDGFGPAVAARLRAAAANAPASRMGVYCRHFAFADRIERARVEDQ